MFLRGPRAFLRRPFLSFWPSVYDHVHGCHCGPNSDHWSDSDRLSKMVRFLTDYLLQELRYSHFKFVWRITPVLKKKKIQFLLAEINIIRYMKLVKTELLSSKLVQFSKQNSNGNIWASVKDNPSNAER